MYTGLFSCECRALCKHVWSCFHIDTGLVSHVHSCVSVHIYTGLFSHEYRALSHVYKYMYGAVSIWYRARVTVNSCVSFHVYTGLFSREDRALSHVCVYMYGVVFILIHGPCHMYIPASLFNPLCRSIGAHLPLQRTTQVGGEIVPIFVVFLRLFFDTACMKL